MTVEPDEVTALIAATLAKAHAAPKASAVQLEARAPDFMALATQIRDVLADACLIRTDAYSVTTQNVLSAEPLRRMLVNTVEQMTLAQRERWELAGYYRARTEMMQEMRHGNT